MSVPLICRAPLAAEIWPPSHSGEVVTTAHRSFRLRAIRGLRDAAIECQYNGLETRRMFLGLLYDEIVFVDVFDRCSMF